MAIDLLADTPQGIDLLADDPVGQSAGPQLSFADLSKKDQQKALAKSRQQLAAQYPNMPGWMIDMMLSAAPKDDSPNLQNVANTAKEISDPYGMVGGALMQGFQTPFQGAASFIPGKIAQDYAKEDFTKYVPQPRNDDERMLKGASEIAGSLGPIGKLFGALKAGATAAKVPKVLRNATALAGTGAIATPGDAEDKATGAAGSVALGGAGKVVSKVGSAIGSKIPAFFRGLTNESTAESLAESIQKPHDILEDTADRLYGYVKDSIKKRKINIPVEKQYIAQAEEILPQTRASKKLIYDASKGDYDAVHDLQSQLYKKGTAGLASDDIAIQNQGDEILDLRNKINEELNDHLVKTGHVDIAHVLGQGKSVYKKIMDTYYHRNLPKSIGKMVQSDLRLIPENPEKIFTQNSKPMKKFLRQHPETVKHAQGIKEKEDAKKALNRILGTTATVGGVGYVGKSILDLLK